MSGAAPTVRAAVCLAVIAVAALIVPVGLAAAAAAVLLAAVIGDAWTVRRAPSVARRAPRRLSRGVPAPLEVELAGTRASARTVLLRQPAGGALQIIGGRGRDRLTAQIVARRRGRHLLPAVASASLGPLGLARVGHRAGTAAQEIAVYPDLVNARGLLARREREHAGHPGGLAHGPLGLGTDLESVREYGPNDDIRQLNWRATARLGRPMSNQYRVEREREVTCLVDCGRLMMAPLKDRTMLDCALDAVTVIALAADALGDRCGALAVDEEIRREIPPGRRSGQQVVDGLFDLQAMAVDTDFERAFVRVGRSRRGLVAVFTDLVDEAAARSLLRGIPMLARRHTVLVACPRDPVLDDVVASGALAAVSDLERAAGIVAADVLETRRLATVALRRIGALVLEAPAVELPARCLDGYLGLKRRGRV